MKVVIEVSTKEYEHVRNFNTILHNNKYITAYTLNEYIKKGEKHEKDQHGKQQI